MQHQSITADNIITAYRSGIFPMARGRYGTMGFFSYEPRAIIPLDNTFKIKKSLRKIIEDGRFVTTIDTAFEQVIRSCARYDELPNDEIWISEEMIVLYTELHKRAIAHSVESWKDGELMGGLYGLAIGSVFCGESMFSKAPYASQVALVTLVEHLRKTGFTLLDAQMESNHLKQFGAYSVTQATYLTMLGRSIEKDCQW